MERERCREIISKEDKSNLVKASLPLHYEVTGVPLKGLLSVLFCSATEFLLKVGKNYCKKLKISYLSKAYLKD